MEQIQIIEFTPEDIIEFSNLKEVQTGCKPSFLQIKAALRYSVEKSFPKFQLKQIRSSENPHKLGFVMQNKDIN